jgi:hypothetical protein
MTEVVEMLCARTAAPFALFTMATAYPVAPGDAFQLNVGVRVLTVATNGTTLPGDNPVGAAGIATFDGKTLRSTGFELPPPGDGLLTITAKFPAVARSPVLRVISS